MVIGMCRSKAERDITSQRGARLCWKPAAECPCLHPRGREGSASQAVGVRVTREPAVVLGQDPENTRKCVAPEKSLPSSRPCRFVPDAGQGFRFRLTCLLPALRLTFDSSVPLSVLTALELPLETPQRNRLSFARSRPARAEPPLTESGSVQMFLTPAGQALAVRQPIPAQSRRARGP